MTGPIAIVGLSCVYPDARTPAELWENVLSQRRAFRRLPDERLRSADYFSPDAQAPDRTYSVEGAVIEGYEFDRVAFRVVGSTYRSADLAHWLALDVAARALADAGYANGDGLNRDTAGVVLGNTLTGEFSRANLMRLRWPYVRRVLDSALREQDWDAGQRAEFLEGLEADYKAPFPPVGEETLAGGLSNTIAGRICNQFDLKGGGYTVDGACASSLLAVANACSSLAAGDLDVALAGGVDLSLDPFEIIGFAKTGALAPELMRIYDRRSAGFWPGEGSGFAVLMRHEDAVAQGRRIYGIVRGWGVSSDGSGGITRPEADGQLQAIRRAYRRAGYGIDTVEYFEGHGTGTSVGDATELEVLSRARREARADAPPAAIGSIKANIGHTKAAAGIAGFIKAVLAVHTQTLPPTTGCERPHEHFSSPSPALRVLREPEAWPADRPLRAGVSAMGFGGINAHVTLEGVAAGRRHKLSARESMLAASTQDAELFLFGGADENDLLRQVGKVLGFAGRISRSEMADLAGVLAGRVLETRVRAAVVASSPKELAARLAALRERLAGGISLVLNSEAGLFLGGAQAAPRIGFLFPGQGSPSHLGGGAWRRRFAGVREIYERSGLPAAGDGIPTEIAQPAVVTASLAGLELLRELGITASLAVGHSLGEITALHWAGAFDAAALLRIARARGQAMAELGSPTGTMAAIAAPWMQVAPLLNREPVWIVGYNSPYQTVIAGEGLAVKAVATRAHAQRMRVVTLPVSHAFHTPLVAAAAPALAAHLEQEVFAPMQRPIVSTVSLERPAGGGDLKALLVRQVTSPVQFTEALAAADREVDLWIEAGPGHVLSSLAYDSGAKPAFALDAGGDSLKGLLQAVGAAFAAGAPVRTSMLFENRFTRPFSLDWQPKFFVNPCELAPILDEQTPPAVEGHAHRQHTEHLADTPAAPERARDVTASPLDVVRELVAARAELPAASVLPEHRLLGDLHLNSITVGQLVAEAARRLGLAPLASLNEFANATVGQVAQALDEIQKTGSRAASPPAALLPAGAASWVRPFVIELVEKPLPGRQNSQAHGDWQLLASGTHPLAAALRAALPALPGAGVMVCLPLDPGERGITLLLEGAKAAQALGAGARFVVVQPGWGGSGFAKTLHRESPEIITCIVNVPFDQPEAAAWVAREVTAATGFAEAHYDAAGVRREPRLKLLSTPPAGAAMLKLTAADVVLVTGGGKGIAAECALALARQTGARLALLGRSQPGADSELAANLERMKATGLRAGYYAADVTDAVAVRRAVAAAERDLGRITVVVHGAGKNVPKLIPTLEEADFRHTLAPKLDGLNHVLAAVDPKQLRALVTFGSIIARAGLPGEADYALANEWLARRTVELQAAHPACRCLALEWSVWSGAGMGERLGRIETLLQQGITPIPVDAGVAVMNELLLGPALPAVAVVVSGRFGETPTLTMDRPELPFTRFLERTRVHVPGVELVVEAELSADNDPYVEDHALQGERLFPAVMGLEAMAQAAMALAGTSDPPSFERVELMRPVVVPRAGSTVIRVAALVRGPREVEAVLRCAETNFQADHFRVICRFGPEPETAAQAFATRPAAVSPLDLSAPPLPLDPVEDVYRALLFHTGRFQRVKNYRLLRARECLAQLEPDTKSAWFGRHLPETKVLGDAGVRDAAIHAIQACIPHARLLPVGVERIHVGKVPCLEQRLRERGGPIPVLLLHARERVREGDTFTYDLELLGEDGTVLEEWIGLKLRRVADIPRQAPWPVPLIGPYVERRLEELLPASRLAVVLQHSADPGRQARSDAAIAAVLGGEAPVRRRPDGRPEAPGGRSVSAAHAGDLTLAVAGAGAIGCDLEVVTARTRQAWNDLLGQDRLRLAEMVSRDAGEDLDAAATRVWTAMESLKKSGAAHDAPLSLAQTTKDGWVLFASGAARVATHVAAIGTEERRMALGVLAG